MKDKSKDPNGTLVDSTDDSTDDSSGDTMDQRLWKIRSTLMRVKRPERVCAIRGRTLTSIKGKVLDSRRPPKRPFDCEGDQCDVCFQQFFPAAVIVTDKQAQSMISTLVNGIMDDLAYLRNAISQHGPNIASRWRNKSKAKRTDLLSQHTSLFPQKWGALHLLDAHSENSPDRQFMIDTVTKSAKDSDKLVMTYLSNHIHKFLLDFMAKSEWRDTWLLPYLDIETLAEDPARLLGLFHQRARYHPSEWVGFDNTQLVLSEHLAVLNPTFNKNCVVLKATGYGSLVPWDAEKAHRWQIVGFNKAHHLFTAQAAMMRFLAKMVCQLVPTSVVIEPFELADPPTSPVFDLLHLSKDRPTSTLRSHYVEQPFRSPPRCKPEQMLNDVRTRWRAAADELELLQIDPAYLQLRVRELASGSYFMHVGATEKWNWFTDEIILNALRRETYWRQLVWECENLVRAYHLSDSSAEQTHPSEYDVMLYVVLDCCVELLALQIEMLQFGLPFQKGFENNYDFESYVDTKTGARQPRVIRSDYFVKDPLFWSLSCIGFDDYRPFTLDPVFNLRVLDDYITNAAKGDKGRLNQQTYDQIGDIAVVDEIRFSVRCDTTRCQKITSAMRKEIMRHPQRINYIKKIQKVSFVQINLGLRGSLCDASSGPLWPTGPKNEEWLAKADQYRANTSRFWARLRTHYKSGLIKAGFSEDFIRTEIDNVSADQSRAFSVELEAERSEILRRVHMTNTAKSVRPSQRDYSPLWLDPVYTHKENAPILSPLVPKVKTRRAASKTDDSLIETHEDMDEAQKSPKHVDVAKENLLVFKQMFPNGVEHFSRRLSWQHFCKAMVDAGFSLHQGSGSSVCFKQTTKTNEDLDGDSEGSIVFHRPHPHSSIDPVMLRSMGKRMSKWFGWHRELFVERNN
ncbi:hypothetical protein C1H76_3035 [Elsinoe australis]|uniref:Uncharacterized protein n=1 Tax=Elsinoe australis TaxID=40998 RepID=A0A4U7B124_9PEZI|nr:hypothetical protein C1H76_3035 [Elsinoe australis]